MPLQATSGAASYDAFGGGVPVVPNYIEDVFSDYLFSGTSASNTINNGVDASGKGALVWIKDRGAASTPHMLFDTTRGVGKYIQSNSTGSQGNIADTLTAFNSNGFTLGADSFGVCNASGHNYVSWMFREAPKFFDVVTWTGSNDSGTSIGQGIVPHNLGSAPGCVIIKNVTQGATNWIVYHKSLSGGYRMLLNTTDAQTNTSPTAYFSKYVSGVGWTQTNPDANNIYVGYNYQTNGNTDTLVAYLFADNAGGFGLTGTDNVISCGSYTGTSVVGNEINLGYEPQFIIIKRATGTAEHWQMFDNMRGIATGGNDAVLYPSLSNAEYAAANAIGLTATGFKIEGSGLNVSGDTYIYIAIRRGPMKVPTSGTSVYSGVTRTGTGAAATVTGVGFSPDLIIGKPRTGFAVGTAQFDRLRGTSVYLAPSWTDAEITDTTMVTSFNMDGVSLGADTVQKYFNGSGGTYANWIFRRAPRFFDEVCYTGDGNQPRQLNHNLSVVPEFIICKSRSNAADWIVYYGVLGKYLKLNTTDAGATSSGFWPASYPPTSSTFNVGDFINWSGQTFVAYLFASCAGVSKVGSYTGTGATQTIACGFTGGARFVLIKRTDTTGDWYVWDTARGMVSGTDPSLLLNSTAAEVNANSIYTTTGGFQIVSTAAGINASGGTFIFLAIA